MSLLNLSTSADVELTVLYVPGFDRSELFASASRNARSVLDGVNSKVLRSIDRANLPGISSQRVQLAILPVAEDVGFESEKKGLFESYEVSALRPDYFLPP